MVHINIYLTRMHSSRIRTVRSSSHFCRGVSASVHAGIPIPPGSRQPPLLGPGLPGPGTHTPESRHPPDQAPPPPSGQTDACKNITFVADGKNLSNGAPKRSPFILSSEMKIVFEVILSRPQSFRGEERYSWSKSYQSLDHLLLGVISACFHVPFT